MRDTTYDAESTTKAADVLDYHKAFFDSHDAYHLGRIATKTKLPNGYTIIVDIRAPTAKRRTRKGTTT